MSIGMALSHHNTISDPPRGTLKDHLVRYRLALYLFSGAAVASGVAMNWNWLTAARILPIVAFLLCMLMMFMCMRHGTRRSDEETALQHRALPPRFPTSSDPQ
jgi:fatty acid desaturase